MLPYKPMPRPLLLAAIMIAPLLTGAAEMVHIKPKDHLLGDVHPFFHNGECYLYYLKPGKYESALVRSTDLTSWNPSVLTHEATKPDDWISPYYVLGLFDDPGSKVFRSFYGHAKGRMVSSVSDDLFHWSCAPKAFHVPEGDYYERRRDPFVFWIPEMKQYGCVMTTWMKGEAKASGGAVSLATSPDLKQWQDHGPIIHPGDIGEPECPQMFHLGGRWYLLASIYDRAVGKPDYWVSKSILGPWSRRPAGALDGKDLCAAQVAFNDEIPLLFGWIPLLPARPGKQTWGGHLALPREVYALPDGMLRTRLAERVAKAFDALEWTSHLGSWRSMIAEFSVKLPSDGKAIVIGMQPLGEVVISTKKIQIRDGKSECWSELEVELPADTAFDVSVVVDVDIVEVFAAGKHSLAARLPMVDSTSYWTTGPGVEAKRSVEWQMSP